MLGIIWMCSLVSIIAIAGVVYFHHEDTSTENKK